MANKTSPHILNTSANLLGLCLFVITSLQISDKMEADYIDEFTCIIAIILTFSCIFSFISIRTSKPKREELLETIADYFFMIALLGILIVIILITFNFL